MVDASAKEAVRSAAGDLGSGIYEVEMKSFHEEPNEEDEE